jgi:hypothetical protein
MVEVVDPKLLLYYISKLFLKETIQKRIDIALKSSLKIIAY